MSNDMPSQTTNPTTPSNRNMTHCRSCGARISKKTEVCPNCGANNYAPFYEKWWFRLIVIFVIIGVFVLFVSKKSSQAPDPIPPSSQSIAKILPSSSSVPENSSIPENSFSSESPSEPEISSPSGGGSNVFVPGDTVETEYFRITYQECDSDWREYSRFGEPHDGNKIIMAYFVFENISNEDHRCGSIYFSCYADDISCSSYHQAYDNFLSVETISPGRKLQGCIAYEVPIDAEEIELEYEEIISLIADRSNKFIFSVE